MKENIEEAIDRLEYVNRAYDCNNYYSRYDLDYIQILLSDYKRVLKENEELEEINNELEAEKNEAIRRYNFETIPKQKVKDKIKELEKKQRYYYSQYKIEELNDKIQVLQELLEGRK